MTAKASSNRRGPGATHAITALKGRSASRDVLVGFAAAPLLHELSFADVLDEDSGAGYQRRVSDQHSLDFRRYIRKVGSTTIPLTFNLRPTRSSDWRLRSRRDGTVTLEITRGATRVLAQVDCQHRMGHIGDVDVTLPFMIFVGLSAREEMEVFNTINSKARGLSGSLLDYHDARLTTDLGVERPELLIALHLNEAETSPWHKQLDLGGIATSGLKRRASLRTMQKAVRRFLTSTGILSTMPAADVARIVHDFWIAVSTVLRDQWLEPRRHFLTKGVGVYALMGVLGDLWKEATESRREPSVTFFASRLGDFAIDFDWSSEGPLKGLGGEGGANEAHDLLRTVRHTANTPILALVNG